MPEAPLIYWDACVFLSYISGVADRVDDIEGLLAQAEKGSIRLITSAATVVEVAMSETERMGGVLDPLDEAKIAGLWLPPSPVSLVDFHALIAAGALRLIRDGVPKGWRLKPMDAIHLATAQRQEADEIHTYSTDWDKYAPILGCKICRPFLKEPHLPLS
jgi:predicted nucleic acid-binding protein